MKSELLRNIFIWWSQNEQNYEGRRVTNKMLIDDIKKDVLTRGWSNETILKYITKVRSGEYDKDFIFGDDVVENVKENISRAQVFRPQVEQGEEPDFEDPLSELIEIPESWAEINVPFQITGVTNLGVCNDLHLPYHDRYAIQACLAEFKRRKVDGIYLNGDTMDYEKVSRYAQTPDGKYLKDEIEVGRKFLKSLRQMFPDIPMYFKAGNHENRLEHYIGNHCPELYNFFGADTQTQLGLADLNITYVEEQRVARFGKLWIAHGHELGLKSGTVNIARQVRMRVGVNIMFGHWHKQQTESSRNLADEVHASWALGCLCYLKPRYTGVLNQWTQGAATVKLHEDGQNFTVSTFQIQDGVVI